MASSGFGQRLRAAMAIMGLDARALAIKTKVALSTVYRWLEADQIPKPFDSQVMTRLSDVLHVSGRYLIWGAQEKMLRISLTPDEAGDVERFLALSPEERARALGRHVPRKQ